MSELRSVSFRCAGHPEIRASHRKSVEFTTESRITTRATCVLGVGADVDPGVLTGFRGPLTISIRSGARAAQIRAVANPHFEPHSSVIVRTTRHADPATLAVAADRGADGLDRELVAELARPGATVTVTVTEQPAPARPGRGRLTVVSLPTLAAQDLGGRSRELLGAADLVVSDAPAGTRALLGGPAGRVTGHRHGEDDAGLRERLGAGEHVAAVALPEGDTRGLARLSTVAAETGAALRVLPEPSCELAALLAAVPLDRPALLAPGQPDVAALGQARHAANLAGAGLVWRGSADSLDRALDALSAAGHTARPDGTAEPGDAPEPGDAEVRVWVGVRLSSPQGLVLRGTATQVRRQWAGLGRPPGEPVVIVVGPAGAPGGAPDPSDELLTALLAQGVTTRTLAAALASLPGHDYRADYRRLLGLKPPPEGAGQR